MNTVLVIVAITLTLLSEAHNLWSRRKLKRRIEYYKGEVHRMRQMMVSGGM